MDGGRSNTVQSRVPFGITQDPSDTFLKDGECDGEEYTI